MNEEILAEIRNKITVPKVALEKLAKGERVPKEFLGMASKFNFVKKSTFLPPALDKPILCVIVSTLIDEKSILES